MGNTDASECEIGRIVWVDGLPDRNGKNAKSRRCVVIKRIEDKSGSVLVLIAATSQFDSGNLHEYEEPLKHGNPQQPSRLSFVRPTVARCDWLAIVDEPNCEICGGPVPKVQLTSLLEKVGKAVARKEHIIVRDDRSDDMDRGDD